MDANSHFHTDQKEMEQIVTSFYSNLFTSNHLSPVDIVRVVDLVSPTIPPSTMETLSKDFTIEEVKKALFNLNPSKAPGPDGLTALFFQNAWDTMKEDITRAVLGVLNNGDSLTQWNDTIIALIPKSKEPT